MFSYYSKSLIFLFLAVTFVSCRDFNSTSSSEISKKPNENNSYLEYLEGFDNYPDDLEGYRKLLNTSGSNFNSLSSTWNWQQDQSFEVYTTLHGKLNVGSPFFDGQSPASLDIAPSEVKPEDGWKLLHKNFGSSEFPVETPTFMLYNVYTNEVKVFFYNAIEDEDYSQTLVRVRVETPTSSPPYNTQLLNFYNDYHYDDGIKQTIVPTKMSYLSWSYFKFELSGFDDGLGSGEYTDATLELVGFGVDEQKLNISGTTTLEASYDSGEGNFMSGVNSLLNTLNGGTKFADFISDFNQVDESNDNAVNQAEEENKPEVKSKLLEFVSLALKDYIPALSEVSGMITRLIGGGGSGKLTRLSGTINLSGEGVTFSNNVFQLAVGVPGAQRTNNSVGVPRTDKLPGIFALDSPISVPEINSSRRCERNRTDCVYYRTYEITDIDLNINPFYENNGFNVTMKAGLINRNTGVLMGEFESINDMIGSKIFTEEGRGLPYPNYGLTIRAKIDKPDDNLDPITYFKNYGLHL